MEMGAKWMGRAETLLTTGLTHDYPVDNCGYDTLTSWVPEADLDCWTLGRCQTPNKMNSSLKTSNCHPGNMFWLHHLEPLCTPARVLDLLTVRNDLKNAFINSDQTLKLHGQDWSSTYPPSAWELNIKWIYAISSSPFFWHLSAHVFGAGIHHRDLRFASTSVEKSSMV